MSRPALDQLKRQISLRDQLPAQDGRPARRLSRGRWRGLCPLHDDPQPSFWVDPSQSLFYCYGGGRGGDVIRLAELYHQVRFPQAGALLQPGRGWPPILQKAADFYRLQLHHHGAAVAYLYQRGVRSPEALQHLPIGYAPGGCLRGGRTQLGDPPQVLRPAGWVTGAGQDTYLHRSVFPLEANLQGRSLSAPAPAQRFLSGAQGGLQLWEQVQQCPEVILVEGLFDYAVLWQAGFHHVTCSMGIPRNLRQYRPLCDRRRTVYRALDADTNGSGQEAAQSLACQLREQGVKARRVSLPDGHDPNRFLVESGAVHQFQELLEAAWP